MVFNIHGGDNPFQEVGIPDLLCCYSGIFIGLELKVPGGKPSARQRHNLKKIEAAGGYGRVVDSVEEVEHLLERIDRKGVV